MRWSWGDLKTVKLACVFSFFFFFNSLIESGWLNESNEKLRKREIWGDWSEYPNGRGHTTLKTGAVVAASIGERGVVTHPGGRCRRREGRPLAGHGSLDQVGGRRPRTGSTTRRQIDHLTHGALLPWRPAVTIHRRVPRTVATRRPFVMIEMIVHRLLIFV